MRFTTREDIAAPIETVFSAVTDFSAFERAALRRGAEVQRLGDHKEKGPGQGWQARFRYRGRTREMVSEIERYAPPEALVVFGGIGGVEGTLALELTRLAPGRTRLKVDLDLRPKSLGARIFLQSLRLAKGALTSRFKSRIHVFARRIEEGGRQG